MSVSDCELLVIGSGPAGQKGAIAAARAGKRVALVDRTIMMGGRACPYLSMAVEKGAKTAVVWLLFTLPLSLLEGGVLSERPAAVKGAPVLRGEANPSRRGPF